MKLQHLPGIPHFAKHVQIDFCKSLLHSQLIKPVWMGWCDTQEMKDVLLLPHDIRKFTPRSHTTLGGVCLAHGAFTQLAARDAAVADPLQKTKKVIRVKWRNQASCCLRSFFLDTAKNAPLMLQEIIFILSRLNFFLPSFSQKKIRERKRWQERASKTPPVFFGEPRSYLTISGQPQEKHIPGWECFAGGVIID